MSWVEEFGKIWRSVELDILGKVELDSGEGFQVLWGRVWVGSRHGRVDVNAGELGEVWGWILDGLEVWDGSSSEGRRRKKMQNFAEEEEGIQLGFSRSLRLSLDGQRVVKEWR